MLVPKEAAGSSPVAPANSSTRTPLSSVKTCQGSITSALLKITGPNYVLLYKLKGGIRRCIWRGVYLRLPGHLSLQVGLRPSVPCLAQLSSPQLNSGTASNCFSRVSGWNRRGKEFRRHKSCDVRNLCSIESIMDAD